VDFDGRDETRAKIQGNQDKGRKNPPLPHAAGEFDPAFGQTALAVFDFNQNLVDISRGSNFAVRRQILDCVSSNRLLSDTSLVLIKRRPFDFLVERPFLKKSRRSLCDFERVPVAFLSWFFEPSLQRAIIEELMADLTSGEVDNGPVAAYA